MNEVRDFFVKLFDVSDFPPRWHCGHWSQFHGWLYLLSDLAIWGAYFAIPLLILRYISRRHGMQFFRIYVLFAAFILACGATHFLDALAFWMPYYRLSALVRFVTAVISWITVFSLVKLLPVAFSLKTTEQLEAEIEHRKRVEEQLQVNNRLLTEAQEIARLGHWQWDIPNNRILWSDMALRIYGFTADEQEMTYEMYLEKIHPEDKIFVHDSIMIGFRDSVFPKFYHRIILPGGPVRTMLCKGEMSFSAAGEPVRITGTVQDITEIRNAEQELLLKTQRLEASNTELQKFASIASHDLREPLRKIITFGSMLEKEAEEKLGDKGIMYLQKITGSATRMQKLIDDILDLSKLTVNSPVFEKTDLNEVLAQVRSDMEVTINNAAANIQIDYLPELDGNASQLCQLFQNLLTNAIKFTRPGTPPEIKIWADIITAAALPGLIAKPPGHSYSVMGNPDYSESERFAKIMVQDNGIGFDEVYLDKIFLIFQRLHDKTAYEGTGIGLAVCKKIAELHNGYITATSTPGAGTTFIIILPLFHKPDDDN